MQKFLSIPLTATGETSQLISANDIVLIEQGSTTTIVITYQGGKINTLTIGAAMAANDVSVRDRIQGAVISAWQSSWTNVKHDLSLAGLVDNTGAAVTITGIAVS
tara:strand:- start:8646 stop:8960 length:315 start_codon:yes stop_codon:yes gene_type:complete